MSDERVFHALNRVVNDVYDGRRTLHRQEYIEGRETLVRRRRRRADRDRLAIQVPTADQIGCGEEHRWETALTILAEEPERKPRIKKAGKKDEDEPDEGPLVAVVWRSGEDGDEWHAGNPGKVEPWPASVLASRSKEYQDLARLGDEDVPTIVLNRDYAPLERYLRARIDGGGGRDLTAAGADAARDRYAVGVGLGLLLQDKERERLRKAAIRLDDEADLHQRQALARSVLVMMPEYDALLDRLD